MRKKYSEILDQLRENVFPLPDSERDFEGAIPTWIARCLSRIGALKSKRVTLGDPPAQNAATLRKAETARLSEAPKPVEEVLENLLPYCYGMIGWGSPLWQGNVIPPSGIASIVAATLAVVLNPNLVWDEYCQDVARIEIEAISKAAKLIGYGKGVSGFFTFGGTGTLLYAARVGLERCKKDLGRFSREQCVIFTSDRSHYSVRTVADYLGIRPEHVIHIPSDRENAMRIDVLHDLARAKVRAGFSVAAFIGTVGTTDTFGLDDVAAMVKVRNELGKEFGLPYVPHVHADAVAGWAWSVFNDYDFDANELGFTTATLRALKRVASRTSALRFADSVGVDIHKTGFGPCTSSAIIFKSKSSLDLLRWDKNSKAPLFQTGSYHPGLVTLETSRSAVGAMGAWASFESLGKIGFQCILGHLVDMARKLRGRLNRIDFVHVLNRHNDGPVTILRIYPDRENAQRSKQNDWAKNDLRTLRRLNMFNKEVCEQIRRRAREGNGPLLGQTDGHQIIGRDGRVIQNHAVALRSYIISPAVDESHVDEVIQSIIDARDHVLGTRDVSSARRTPRKQFDGRS